MSVATGPVFDLCGTALPQGTTVLEASAGTGKTHTIAGLAARYLAEGVARIDELMLVTFGRAATAELRERVRQRLTEVTAALEDPAAAGTSDDDLVRKLAEGSDDVVRQRWRRLARGLADFDAATIATTHGFCHQMLAGLGIAADLDADVTFADQTSDIVADVATDLYLADYGREDSPLPADGFGFPVAAGLAREAVGDPAAVLEPADAEPGTSPFVRVDFTRRTRVEVQARKRRMRVMDYDDLLVYLRDALCHPETGEDACERIRSRYKIVLVDEFQDTDPVQWEILERTFHGHRTLVLIGDPKQAIYAFRGADVVTYLLAKDAAASEATLGRNWRSDRPLVEGLAHLLGDTALGDQDIVVGPVDAAHPDPSLVGAPVSAPVRIRRTPRSVFGASVKGKVTVGQARPYVAQDVAADIAELLSSGAEIVERGGRRRPLEAADVAVLVRRNDDGAAVRDALAAVDVPVVLTATTSVFLSGAAEQWLTLLSALEQPNRSGLLRSAALTDFVGWSARDLASADEPRQEVLGARLRSWAETLTDRGVAALMEAVTATGLPQRVLARDDGERDLTDLRHIGQALHAAATEGHGGVSSLVQWLQHRMAEAVGDVDEERSRRLDSDAKAVQVMTIWRAKGLEFPVVYAPFLWDRWVPRDPSPMRLHRPDGQRVLDVGGSEGPGYRERKEVHLREEAGEALRLAYVALTRARCQVVAYWVPSSNTPASPLHRLLLGERSPEGFVPDIVGVPGDEEARSRLEGLAAASGGLVAVETTGPGSSARFAPPPPGSENLTVRSFGRALDRAWGRTSYTGLTAGLHEASGVVHALSEPEGPGSTDEPPLPEEVLSAPAAGTSADVLVSPMGDLPSGAAFGTLVHAVLERVDFAADDLSAELAAAADAEGSERFVGVASPVLAEALKPSLETPLGPLAANRRLVDLTRRDRLDELEFELPLAGGDAPVGSVPVREVAALLRRHLPADDPLAGYADDLDVPLLSERRLRGFLTGSIDAVLRVPGEGGAPRYLVVDYKTNRLGGREVLTAEDYGPDELANAMRHAHYPLQALLYSVALHRYLRWRQPGYDPSTHLGGVLYLFLRGMCGPVTPSAGGVPPGVFSWSPPAALVTDLSDLLHGPGTDPGSSGPGSSVPGSSAPGSRGPDSAGGAS
ncbi:MAG TPA: UvrD-helicase domain-containing protein [Nocardioidaceae bacterium]